MHESAGSETDHINQSQSENAADGIDQFGVGSETVKLFRVVGEHIGHEGDAAASADYRQLGPGKNESDARPIGFRQIGIVAARGAIAACQFGITKRADQRHDAAHDPGEHSKTGAARRTEDFRRGLVDRCTDDDADNETDRIPKSQLRPTALWARVDSRSQLLANHPVLSMRSAAALL